MKIIVAHSGWQHSAHLAYALQKAGCLESYVTTVYDSPRSRLVQLLKKMPSNAFRSGITTRRFDGLRDESISTRFSLSGILSIIFSRFGWKKLYELNERQLNWRFGKWVARYAVQEKADVLVMYEGKAAGAFRYLKTHAPEVLCIIDSASACSLYVAKAMKEEYERVGSGEPFFQSLLVEDPRASSVKDELSLADKYLVASRYVKQTLVDFGFRSSDVMVCAYGGNFSVLDKPKEAPLNRPLRFAYCGRVTPQKGVHNLLQAFRGREDRLALIGAFDTQDTYLQGFADEGNIEFVGKVPHDAVAHYLDWADVFVFPSLSDGMSLACEEAMCRGLPVVCTDRTGVCDFVVGGVNGFVVPAGNVDALIEALDWFGCHASDIPRMSGHALATARELSWGRYDKEIAKLFSELER